MEYTCADVEVSNCLNLLKPNEDRRESRGRVVRDTTLNGRNRDKVSAMKVPRQCPLVLLPKVG
jgi:hypothetical protein